VTGRQFRQSSRSLDGPNPRRKRRAQPADADLGTLAGHTDDPSRLATVLVDYREWLATLTPQERDFLEAFLFGEATQEIARRMQVSPGRVSQVRRELVTYWMAFTSE
jgi:DNA-directed RNA polymerase specialized sigma24 family protein